MARTLERTMLSNGLTIVAEPSPDAHSSAVGFFVRTGTRDESGPIMGVSHYLEHMLFKGTDDISADQLNRAFDAMGARNNAYTSHELTCYYAHVIPDELPKAIDLLSAMMRPALRQDDFDTEKGVILEEIAMYDDNPFSVLYDATAEKHFGDHPLGFKVLGTKQSVSDLTSEQMMRYFSSRYVPDAMTVALTGSIDVPSAIAQLETLTCGWDRGSAPRDNASKPTGGGRFTLQRDDVARGYLLGMADAPAIDDPARHAFSIASHICGGGDNSRLHWALIETGIAEEAAAGAEFRDGSGVFMCYASGDPAQLETIEREMTGAIETLVESITDDELERVKSKIATQIMVGSERPADQMRRLGRLMTLTGQAETLEAELDRFLAVNSDDLRDVLARFSLDPTTVGLLMPV